MQHYHAVLSHDGTIIVRRVTGEHELCPLLTAESTAGGAAGIRDMVNMQTSQGTDKADQTDTAGKATRQTGIRTAIDGVSVTIYAVTIDIIHRRESASS